MALPSKPANAGLQFSGMTDLGINRGFDLQYHVGDKAATTYLCVGSDTNRVLVTHTTPHSRQAAVLDAIDELRKWGASIQLWMVAERDGAVTGKSPSVAYTAHVQPYAGELRISSIATAKPPLLYPGNGVGRLLSRRINERYYFIYNGRLETNPMMRGFDCTSFPMAVLEIASLAQPGYGKQLCEAAEATKCDIEQISSGALESRFKENSIPPGKYILFSEGHVMLYDSDVNTLYEFNFGGFFESSPASERRLKAKHDLWWMRKLGVEYNSAFM